MMLNNSCLIENNYGRFYGLIKSDFDKVTSKEFERLFKECEKEDNGYLIGTLDEINNYRNEYFVNEFTDFDWYAAYTDDKEYILYL